MKHTYHINGMICNGCRSNLEETLSNVKSISSVPVNLEKVKSTMNYKH